MCECLTSLATKAFRSALLCLLLAFAHGAPRAQQGPAPDPDPNAPDAASAQEVIVWLKDDQPYAELRRKIQNFKSPAEKDRAGADYRTQVKRLTEAFLTRVAPHSAAVVKSYANLPVALIKVTDPELLDRLSNAPEVQGIYPNQKHKLFLTESLPLINQHLAADLGAKGKNTAVAILDTGVNYAHPEFGACTAPGAPATCRVVYADDFTTTDDGQLDADGHGTNVAGIAAGVAPETKIIALDVFNGEYANTSDILAAIDWVIQNQTGYNIVAVNMSLGDSQIHASQCTTSIFTGAFQRLRQAGAIPVVASGNDANKSGLTNPACAPGAVSVGAVYDAPFNYMGWQDCTDYSANEGQVTCFSNSAVYLTLLAPGARITAAGLSMSGTSMAAPHVTGAVAVLRGSGGYPGSSVDDIVSYLVDSGRPVRDPRNYLTHPLIDLEAALYVGKPPTPPAITSVTPDSAGRGSTVTIEGSGFVRVSGVSFGGTPAASFRVVSTRRIVAVVGEGASGEVIVTTAHGTATKPGFVYLPALIGITSTPASHVLSFINDQLQLRVEGVYADGTTRDVTQAATFYTSDSSVATVDAQGLVRPVDEGVTTIQSYLNGLYATTSLEVNFLANKVYETEPNDEIDTADSISEDGKIHVGRLGDLSDVDLYKINITDLRLISVLIRPARNTNYGQIRASILDVDGKVLTARIIDGYQHEFINLSMAAHEANTYYLKLENVESFGDFSGDYEFMLQLHDNPVGFSRREVEWNDTPAEANRFTPGASIYGQLSSVADQDYFRFDLSPGIFTVQVKPVESRYGDNRVVIVNAAGTVLAARDIPGHDTTYRTLTARINTADAYYLMITGRAGNSYFDQDYELLPQFSTDESLFEAREHEPNETGAEASVYAVGSSLFGQLSSLDDRDYFAFDLTPGVFKAETRPAGTGYGMYRLAIVNATGVVLAAKAIDGYISAYVPLTARIDMPGRYYVLVTSLNTDSYGDADYEILTQVITDELLFQSLESEPNDTLAVASPYSVGTNIRGQISSTTDMDYFAIDLNSSVFKVELKPEGNSFGYYWLTIVNAAGEVLAARGINEYIWEHVPLTVRIDTPGRYYVLVTSADTNAFNDADYELVIQASTDDPLFHSLESEPNDTPTAAHAYPAGESIYGQFSSALDQDYYAFDLGTSLFKAEFKPDGNRYGNYRLSIVNAAGEVMAAMGVNGYFSGYIPLTVRVDTPGRYYVLVTGTDTYSFNDADYELVTQVSTGDPLFQSRESEPNNTPVSASVYAVEGSIRGQLSSATDKDFHAFDLSASVFRIEFKSDDVGRANYRLSIVNTGGEVLAARGISAYNYGMAPLTVRIDTPGRYYVLVTGWDANVYNDADYEIITQVSTDALLLQSLESEFNDTAATANVYSAGASIHGQVSQVEDKDYYAFDLDASVFRVAFKSDEIRFSLYRLSIVNVAGAVLASREIREYDYDYNMAALTVRIGTPGRYYVRVTGFNAGLFSDSDYEIFAEVSTNEALFRSLESEPNDTPGVANAYNVGADIRGQLSGVEVRDYFAVDLPLSVFVVKIKPIVAEYSYYRIAIMNATGVVMASRGISDYVSAYVPLMVRINTPGRYYVLVTSLSSNSYSNTDYEMVTEVSTYEPLFQSLESEPNDTLAAANVYAIGAGIRGQISGIDDKDYFAFDLYPGIFKVETRPIVGASGGYRMTIITAAGVVLGAKSIGGYGSIYVPVTVRIDTPGRYYVLVTGDFYGDYELVNQVSNDEALFQSLESEPNDTAAAAKVHATGGSIRGQLSSAEDKDYYAFDLSPGVFKVETKPVEGGYDNYRMVIVNASGLVLAVRVVSGYTTTYVPLMVRINVPDTYYVLVTSLNTDFYSEADYEILTQVITDEPLFQSLESEPDDTPAAALTYPAGSSVTGQLSVESDIDYFALNLDKPGVLKIKLSPGDHGYIYLRLSILDETGKVISIKELSAGTWSNTEFSLGIKIKGRYFIVVSCIPGYLGWNSDYHLFFEFDPDTDYDGMVDSIDLDDDGDGMPDDAELAIGRNPLINEPAAVFMILNQNDE